jgi:pimeloyl-ACP methyl ester carboxylesterase
MSMIVLPYELKGEGSQHVIALHGWMSDRRAFASLWPYIETTRFTYAFLDYRGYGAAQATDGEFTIAEIAGDVLATADALGWDRFSLVGHSMGGMVIQRVLADAPSRVERLVGISPVPASGVPFDDTTWELFAGAAEDAVKRRAILDFTTGGRLTGTWLDYMVASSLSRSTRVAFAAYLEGWAKTDFHSEIEGSPVPVLVIVGEHDPALSAEAMQATWLSWYPNAVLQVFANAGHYTPDETPLALVSSLERFLGEEG